MDLFFTSYNNGPRVDNRGLVGVQKDFTDRPLIQSYDSSFCLYSDNTISIKCVRFRMCNPSTFESIHLTNSGDKRMPIYFFAMLNTYLHCNTTENINICFSISNNVKQYKTNRMEIEWNGKRIERE